MRRLKLTLGLPLLLLPLAAACNAIFGIEPFTLYDGGAGGQGGHEGTGGSDGGDEGINPDANDEADAMEICMGTFDLDGCLCDELGATRDCWHGFHGPQSACNMGGTQVCAMGEDGRKHWGTCTGASTPSAEGCYDSIDNDCDGVVDQACLCSMTVDACKHGGSLLDMNKYSFFTDPEMPEANEPFEIFVVTGKSLNSVGLRFNNLCYGHAAQRPCDTAGSNCQGWNIARFETTEKAGTYMVEIMVDDPPGTPCSVPVTAQTMITVN